nr:NUDIX domain-containing protein [Chitinolyticbacter meiyuanensis]
MVVNKACPVVLREAPGGYELLVFRHPLAGVQLVKGTLEPGEAAEAAALRELAEEAGLTAVTPARPLGIWDSGWQGQVWSFQRVTVADALSAQWRHYTSDDGGHEFAFFWHPLAAEPDDDGHPLFAGALHALRVRLAECDCRVLTPPAHGAVACSSRVSQAMAPARSAPHMSSAGCNPPHTAGRSGRPNSLQRQASSSCTHGTPAGLPCGMPGMALEIDGAMQQAAQPLRQDAADDIAALSPLPAGRPNMQV